MSSSRNQIVREPGHVVFDGATFFSGADIEATLTEQTITVQSVRHGAVDESVTGIEVAVKFTPLQFNATALAKLFPFGSLAKGASIFASTDKPIDIHTVSGKRFRIPCGAIFKEPASMWGVKKPILGEVEMRGVLGISATPGALASYYAKSSTAYPGDTDWDLSEVLRPACAASWPQGSATSWDDIWTAEGWTITPEAKLVDDSPDGFGVLNYALADYTVKAAAEVMNISGDDLLAARGFGNAFGSSKSARGKDLKLNATGAFARLYNAVLTGDLPFTFSSEKRYAGPLTWQAMPSFTAGSANPLFLVTDTDPDEGEGGGS